MKFDCGFEIGNNWFRYRAGGILIHDNKMLFVKNKYGDYYYMIGGGVHLGEASNECIEREVFEEAGIHAEAGLLAVVLENFFQGSGGTTYGLNCHEIEFYYHMTILDDLDKCRQTADNGEKLVWLPIEEIKTSSIKPSFIKNNIEVVLNTKQTIHVIQNG